MTNANTFDDEGGDFSAEERAYTESQLGQMEGFIRFWNDRQSVELDGSFSILELHLILEIAEWLKKG